MSHTRGLTEAERAALSGGLVRALDTAGARPWIADGAHPAAWVSSLWRGHVPILTLGQTIHWPQALDDFSASSPNMAILQHELHHVLEFATGVLTPLGYLINPRNWTYKVTVTDTCQWCDFGAEQRAVLAERLWWADRDHTTADERLRALVPWA
jgi:hypothetical protein